MTVLLWLLSMIPPAALFLIAGIWVVRRKYGGVRHVFGEAANPVKPEGPICMLCSPGRLPAKSGHHLRRPRRIGSVRERFLGLKRTIKYGLTRTILVRWHRRGFVVIRELLLEPIRPIHYRLTSTQWVSCAAGQRDGLCDEVPRQGIRIRTEARGHDPDYNWGTVGSLGGGRSRLRRR